MTHKQLPMKIAVIVAFAATIVVNYLSVMVPINGNSPQVVSDFYGNLFAPAGFTFSIWSVIYLMLAAYCVFQFSFKTQASPPALCMAVEKSRFLFCIASLANIVWVFSWQLKAIPLSMLLMLVILGSLMAMSRLFVNLPLKWSEAIMFRLPFSLYFGWITIATIANVVVLLVSLNWDGFGRPAELWTVIVLVVGMLIGGATLLRRKDVAYGLVLVWAYAGILAKHAMASGFGGQYPVVVITASVCGGLLLAACIVQWVLLHLKPVPSVEEVTVVCDNTAVE